jgi:hypothetical protein
MLVKNRALAYSPRLGGWQLNVPGFDVVGDGGLFTTVDDLAKWARNFDDHTVGGDELAARVLTRGRLTSGDSIPYAFGLSHGVYRGQPTIDHGGAYGGYRTQVLRFPVQHFAVVTLCNSSNANAAQLSQSVAAVFLGDRLGPVTWTVSGGNSLGTAAVSLTKAQLTRYAGTYWDARNEALRRIDVRDSTLGITGSPIVLFPVSATMFRGATINISETFTVDRGGSVTMEETTPDGAKLSYRQMPAPKTDARRLAEYAGDYVSDELDATWRIVQRDSSVILRRGAVPDMTLQPVFLDAFTSPVGVVRFARGADGRVTGLVVGAGRVTGFVFRRAPRG